MIKGDTVREVLDYVEFDADTLIRKLRESVEVSVREGRLNFEESGRLLRFYEDGLHGYTYLEDPERIRHRRSSRELSRPCSSSRPLRARVRPGSRVQGRSTRLLPARLGRGRGRPRT